MSRKSAFPFFHHEASTSRASPGMSYRQYLIARCPIPWSAAVAIFGDEPRTDEALAAVTSIHAFACRQWADAIVRQMDQHDQDKEWGR